MRFSRLRFVLFAAAVVTIGMLPIATRAGLPPIPAVVVPNAEAPVAATACIANVYGGFIDVVLNATNRSTRQLQGFGARYQIIDGSGRILDSFANHFSVDLASGDSDAYTYRWGGEVPDGGKQLRCFIVGAAFSGKAWKRGQAWPEKLLPPPPDNATSNATVSP